MTEPRDRMADARYHPRPRTWLAILASIGVGIALGIAGHHLKHAQAPGSTRLATIAEVIREVRDNYVDPRDENKLIDDAITGVVKDLDAHSAYLDERALEDLSEQTSGRFAGIGIELTFEQDRVTVIAPIDDSPAALAGIKAGDVLIELDGRPIASLAPNEIVARLRGEPGSVVSLVFTRADHVAPIKVNLERAIINVASVKSRFLESGYGYVKITQFQNETGAELTRALAKLVAEHGKLAGLVLDLRNNPGGVLQASVDVVDAFLKDGLIVSTKGRQPSADLRFTASGHDVLDGAPMVVLINKGSASASEIVAGALQDHHRAKILGHVSYGKGSVQAILPLDDSHALKLTTARYYTPSGRSIQSDGIHPDVEIPDDDGDDLVLAEAARQLARG